MFWKYSLSSPVLGPQRRFIGTVRASEGIPTVSAVARVDLHFMFVSWHVTKCLGICRQWMTHQERTKYRTTGSGASFCMHITHGTPVLSPTAIVPAHWMYRVPSVL